MALSGHSISTAKRQVHALPGGTRRTAEEGCVPEQRAAALAARQQEDHDKEVLLV